MRRRYCALHVLARRPRLGDARGREQVRGRALFPRRIPAAIQVPHEPSSGDRASEELHGAIRSYSRSQAPRSQAQCRRRTAGLLRPDFQVQHGAAVGKAPSARRQRAQDAMRAGDLALCRREGDGDGVGRPHLVQGGRTAGAGAGESGAARPVAHHPVALCGVAADHARRGRAGPSPHSVRHPLHPRRRRRLYRGRGRAHLHVAGRFRTHPQLGLSRPRQHLGPADDLARRARPADHQFLRVDVLRASRRGIAAGRPCRRRFARPVRLRRIAGRRDRCRSTAAR